jgi:5-deoxy-5-amino-3-dehydroquinate synthase
VGHGARKELGALVPKSARRAAVVTQAGISLTIDPGLPFERFEIGHGEEHKTLESVERLWRGFARLGLTRSDVVISVGGGMVSDVGGFAAATWHRGVAIVHVSTTLVGMVDAAIGGKTGVNLPVSDGVGGKNLVGAYWQPVGVICDLDALATLAPRDIRCGRGEMAKYHFLTGDDLLSIGEAERIARCVQIKADIVADDERDGARRALLNYGHTLAHALEVETDFSMAHGEAVAVGLVYAARLAKRLGRIGPDRVQQHYEVVGGTYELATKLPADVSHERLVALMGADKKVVSEGLTFVLDGPHGVEVVAGVSVTDALGALDDMSP